MSYNITSFQVQELSDFRVPLSVIEDNEDISVELMKKYVMATGLTESFEIYGKLEENWILVETINNGGVGSGASFPDFKNILKESKGKLVARIVWEGGDTTEMLTVENGEVSIKKV